ncbi:MAG: right-handed parallel beta-helix repeat-containing protein [Armatimonadetes bacterium]|nr:right-handed parallel beta-helix repeat-containing protein [Armatimonadota bacterium]
MELRLRRPSTGLHALKAIAAGTAFLTIHQAQGQTLLYVAKNGNDTWSGTLAVPNGKGDGPKATLTGARDEIRKLKIGGKLSSKGAIVTVKPGRYSQLAPFVLSGPDSGASGARIIYRSEKVREAVIDGGKPVTTWLKANERPSLEKIAANVRGYVSVANLKANGIAETGTLSHVGPNITNLPTWGELFFDGQRMPLSKWPNSGFANLLAEGIGNTFDNPTVMVNSSSLKTPTYVKSSNNDQDYWIRGTLNERAFNQFQERVKWIDKGSGNFRIEITDGNTADPARRAAYNPNSIGRLTLVNSLYELDMPGEYYIDRKLGYLYFWSPSSLTGKSVVVSMNPGPMVMLSGANYVDFQAFTVEYGRQDAVQVKNCTSAVVRGNLLRNCGANGVRVEGGNAVLVRSNEITTVGEGGVYCSGGDRAVFRKGNHIIENNYIHHYGAVQPYYRHGVYLTGMGLTCRNNEIAYNSHGAVWFHGNDIQIEYNRIHHVLTDACDSGAIYAGADWTTRDNSIRYNYLHDIRQIRPSVYCNHGIYLDDMWSSANVDHNVFRRVEQPIQIGGGHDNTCDYNVFVDCIGGVRIDDRGLTADQTWINDFWREANRVPWQGQLWRNRYPQVYALLTGTDYRYPFGNTIVGNVSLRGTTNQKFLIWELWGINKNAPEWILKFQNNVLTNTQQFVNEPGGDFTPANGSAAKNVGFKAVSTLSMGVKKDTFLDPAKWGGNGP